jgi:hypothetical protein
VGWIETDETGDAIEMTVSRDDMEHAMPLHDRQMQRVPRLQGNVLTVKLGRQKEVLDRDGQGVWHDLKEEFGHFHGPQSLSQSRIAVQNLLEDLDIGDGGELPGGNGVQNREAGGF